MDLCSVGNNWPWCFNSSMRNQPLLRSIKRIIIVYSCIICILFFNIKQKKMLFRQTNTVDMQQLDNSLFSQQYCLYWTMDLSFICI